MEDQTDPALSLTDLALRSFEHDCTLQTSLKSPKGGEEQVSQYQLMKQAFTFNYKPSKLIILHDVTKLHEVTKLQSQNKMIQLLNSSCNHEMIAPIKCIIDIAAGNHDSSGWKCTRSQVIHNTASFLLNQVMQNLDRSMLDQHKFKPKIEEKVIKNDIVMPVVELYE